MAKPYSDDLRERVVDAVLAGETTRSVARRFAVSVSSVVKWHQRYRQTGSVSPAKMGGRREPILEAHRSFILDAIERTSHLTVRALQALLLSQRGLSVSRHAVWTFMRREGLSFKKNAVRD